MPKRHHRLEAPVIEEEPPVSNIPETPAESAAEQEPLRESVDTVAELIKSWREEYKQTENGERKNELAYKTVRMTEALHYAQLSPEEVKIREAEPGVLGFYVPGSGEIAITTGGLALDPVHFKDVLVHEAIHAGKITSNRISDEGLTQIQTRRKVPGAMHGIYESEQQHTEKTFDKLDIEDVLKMYDFENPAELIDAYLVVEWNDEWENRWQAELAENDDIHSEPGRKELIEGVMKEWLENLEEHFEKALPRLYEAADAKNIKLFAETHEREFARVVKESGQPE